MKEIITYKILFITPFNLHGQDTLRDAIIRLLCI